jgi:hypothetical protein
MKGDPLQILGMAPLEEDPLCFFIPEGVSGLSQPSHQPVSNIHIEEARRMWADLEAEDLPRVVQTDGMSLGATRREAELGMWKYSLVVSAARKVLGQL